MKKVDVAHQALHRTDDLRQALLAFARRSCQTLVRSGELMISRQILLPFFLLAAVLPVPALAAAQGHLCWVARVSKAADGSAEVRFNANARGFGAVLSPGAIRPDLNFRVEGEQLWVGEKTAAALIVPSGKEASMSAGHESCSFRWGNSGGRLGLFIDATSTYVGPGSPPSTSSEFVPLQ